MANLTVPIYPPLKIHSNDLSHVTEWIQGFRSLMRATTITDLTRQRALLLHYIGPDARQELQTITHTGTSDELEPLIDAISKHFVSQRHHGQLRPPSSFEPPLVILDSPPRHSTTAPITTNITLNRHAFCEATQHDNESIDSYHRRLHHLAVQCNFLQQDDEICAQIITTTTSDQLRLRALLKPTTLPELLRLARVIETVEKHSTFPDSIRPPGTTPQSDATSTSMYKTQRQRISAPYHTPTTGRHSQSNLPNIRLTTLRYRLRQQTTRRRIPNNPDGSCNYCGRRHGNNPIHCSARGLACQACGRKNHLAAVCLSCPPVSSLARQTPTSAHVNQTAAAAPPEDNSNTANISIYGKTIQFLIDTGASVNILDECDFRRLFPELSLRPSYANLYTYQSTCPLNTIGEFTAPMSCTTRDGTHQSISATIVVVKDTGLTGQPLLCFKSATSLNLVQMMNPVAKTQTIDQLIHTHSHLFQGLGTSKNTQIKLHIDKTVQPVAQPHRRIPCHIREQVEREIKALLAADIIEPVTDATPWISPILTVAHPTSRAIRIRIDMRRANAAIIRQRHTTPSLRQLSTTLHGATVFSRLSLTQTYHQLRLHTSSRYITTFGTHIGLFRYKRLNAGISSASEIYQATLADILKGISGTVNVDDDIIIHAKNTREHHRTLQQVLQTLAANGLTLDKSSCHFRTDNVTFLGHKFSAAGCSLDLQSISAITDAPPPANTPELRSFLDMTQYFHVHIPDIDVIQAPLRALAVKHAKWNWSHIHQQAFDTLKARLTSKAIMTPFTPHDVTELIVDASPTGLGAILTQKKSTTDQPRVLSYASKALSPIESRYSQTEREALAIVWACEHFHQFLFAKHFSTITDHKPLERLYNSPSAKPPVRIERWALRLQNYDTTVIYRRGSDNPADYISRHPNLSSINRTYESIAEAHVHFVTTNQIPDALTVDTIKAHTASDATLQAVITAVTTGLWYEKHPNTVSIHDFKCYAAQKETLTVSADNQLVLRTDQIAIPLALQQRVIDLAHEGHQGLIKTKQLLRDRVYFPGSDIMIQNTLSACITCQATTPTAHVQPKPTMTSPQEPWQRVVTHILGPLDSGDHIVVLIDSYSQYPVVEISRSISASTLIPRLDKVFAIFGIPHTLVTSTGAPFTTQPFVDFSNRLGFIHTKAQTAQPNPLASINPFLQTLEATARTAQRHDPLTWQQPLHTYLRNFRATPTTSTADCPATLIFQRPLRIKIPAPKTPAHPSRQKIAATNDAAKKKMKTYADTHRHASPMTLCVGDTVLVQQPHKVKMDTPYNPLPYVVHRTNHSMITARRADHFITRNASKFKKIPHQPVPPRTTRDTARKSLQRSLRRSRSPHFMPSHSPIDHRSHSNAEHSHSAAIPTTPLRRSPRLHPSTTVPMQQSPPIPLQNPPDTSPRYPSRRRSSPKWFGEWTSYINQFPHKS
jgi:hypothetical protein